MTIQKYYNFLESIKTPENSKLVGAVLEAAHIIFEQGEVSTEPTKGPAPKLDKERKKAEASGEKTDEIPEESEFRLLAPTFAEQLIEWKEGSRAMVPTIEDYLESHPEDQEAKKFLKYVEDISKTASRLTGYINRISEMGNGQEELPPEELPPEEEIPMEQYPEDEMQMEMEQYPEQEYAEEFPEEEYYDYPQQ